MTKYQWESGIIHLFPQWERLVKIVL